MKHIIPIVLVLFSFGLTGYAQETKSENIKALKTALITKSLNLTSSEAEKFWPVYNHYDQAMHEIRHKKRDEVKKKLQNGMNDMSEEEAKNILQKLQQYREQENKLETQLEKDLSSQLDAVRILKLKKAEHEFKMQMLKKYRGNKK